MKTTLLLSLLMFAGLTAGPLLSARELLVLGSKDPVEPAATARAVASGGTATIDVVIPPTVDREHLWISLHQISGGVTVPLGETQAFAGMPMEKAPLDNFAQVSLSVPKLTRKAEIIAKFYLKAEPPVTLGVMRLVVYPPRDWSPLSRRLKKDGPQLLVFGRDAALREFFQARDIEFSDQGDTPPDHLDNDTLAVGALPAKDWNEHKDRLTPEGGGLIVFVADADALPGVYTTGGGAGLITKVTLPVLAGLTKDPRSEELFFELIEQHLHDAPTAAP